jgi:hypothetical protein
MKIKTVIRAFKKILPIYEKYYNLEITDINEYYGLLSKEYILYGICFACKCQGVLIGSIFSNGGYYKNYVNKHYLYDIPNKYYINSIFFTDYEEKSIVKKIKECLKFRIDFLKREIKHLEKLSLKYDEI